jgi:cell surface protein SprA
VKQSIRNLGTPLDYHQSFKASYQLPLNKLPIFDWLTSDASYDASYSWVRGTDLEDGTSLGNTISNNRSLNINGSLNLETLYNHSPFLKKTNERFKKAPAKKTASSGKSKTSGKSADAQAKKDDAKEQKELPKNKNTFQKEITLLPDSAIILKHDKKSKRLLVSARTPDGKQIQLKWKVKDDNNIKVSLPKDIAARLKAKPIKAEAPVSDKDTLLTDSTAQDSTLAKKTIAKKAMAVAPKDSALKLKISVLPKEPLDNQWWYNPAQQVARLLMSVRTVNISYRNQRSMMLPGFMPNIGDAFGQRTGNVLSPGLDFAFGFNGDGYLDKAKDNGWLLMNDSVATPSTSSSTEDLQLRATVEPLRDLKIDLNASRTMNRSRSVQFMYAGSPTTQSGTFNMTTISIGSAFEGFGDANSGYRSAAFDRLCSLIPQMQQRVQQRYAALGSKGTVNPYGGDVLIPAFLEAYTSGNGGSLDIFPALSRLLPNWSVRYGGLSKITWLADRFKSVNINHSYKSVFSMGSYSSYSSWTQLDGDMGYIVATDGTSTPSSMYNIPTVSIQESFSPLIGMDVTLQNNMTVKLEYRTTRNLNLSMTSVQLNESRSKDWVVGLGYKLSDFNLFGMGGTKGRKVKGKKSSQSGQTAKNDSKSSQSSSARKGGVNHDLNMRLDLSLRKQAAITRDIASGVSSASSGNSAFKLSFAADYTLSRMLTLSAYYDRQTNTPLLSSSSYPTTTRDFGLALKFSLTR